VADLGPQATFDRGYAHVRRQQDGQTVMSPAQATPGTVLSVQVARGRFPAVAGDGASPTGGATKEGTS
ncbi:MAG: exodeoxyribonuclease VII large subunit, partial [Anaerolineae bacterium]